MPNQLKPKSRLLKILKKFVIFVGWIMENTYDKKLYNTASCLHFEYFYYNYTRGICLNFFPI